MSIIATNPMKNSSISFSLSNLSVSKEENKENATINNGPSNLKTANKLKCKCLAKLINVHQDDIHGLIFSKGEVITGSKDGSIKAWKLKDNIISWKHTKMWKPNKINYTSWVTALNGVNGYIFSGTRNGYIDVFQPNRARIGLKAHPYVEKYLDKKYTHKCKKRNFNRVNCIKAMPVQDGKIEYYIGWATQFTLHSYSTKSFKSKFIDYCKTNSNDWVYCIEKVKKGKFLVVTGPCLDIWEAKKTTPSSFWKKKSLIINPSCTSSSERSKYFISAMNRMKINSYYFELALFNGSVQVIDIHKKKIFYCGQEHTGRVWDVVNLTRHVFVSGADDSLIKLWDIRKPGSIFTLKDSPGRVSQLLPLNAHTLISGACPDNVKTSKAKARLTTWDLRV